MNKQDRYEVLASLTPVNKSAAIVTSQTNCDGNIFIETDEERLEVFKAQKRTYADKVFNLKRELKIKPNWNKKSLPGYVLSHPKYQYLVELRAKLSELDVKINKLNKELKPPRGGSRFETNFVTMVKEKYPNIFEEIKGIYYNQKLNKRNELNL